MNTASAFTTLFDSSSEDEEIFGGPTTPKGPIDFSAVHAMFNAAAKNGQTKPRFRAAHGLVLSLAPATGRNPGAIYVKQNDDYKGKIVDGKFTPAAVVPVFITDELRKIAADPSAYAISYGRETGNCAICGRLLTAENSVHLGIGPICAERFGFTISAEEVSENKQTITINDVVVNRKQLSEIIGNNAADVLFSHFHK